MTRKRIANLVTLNWLVSILLWLTGSASAQTGEWPQWGGPQRNFTVATKGLASATPAGLKVHAKVALLNQKAWTVPTLVGTKLYVRDRKVMMALELS